MPGICLCCLGIRSSRTHGSLVLLLWVLPRAQACWAAPHPPQGLGPRRCTAGILRRQGRAVELSPLESFVVQSPRTEDVATADEATVSTLDQAEDSRRGRGGLPTPGRSPTCVKTVLQRLLSQLSIFPRTTEHGHFGPHRTQAPP